jgi:saccharopine dehydrogenase (NAD+, L-lysine-forming)
VPINELIPNKKYLFFSHTFKEQPYNRNLLNAILEKNIQLIDWEVITNEKGKRLIAFGRYAGIVGCYNGFIGFGKKHGLYSLKRAHECEDRADMEAQIPNIQLPNDFKLVLTGKGRVAGGAIEVLDKIGLEKVSPKDFLEKSFNEPVYTQLGVEYYNKNKDGKPFNKKSFFNDPTQHESDFLRFAQVANMYIACHYWDSRAPFIFSREDLKDENWKISIVADVSCDIDCAVASTIRPSTIADPFYGYNKQTEAEDDFMKEEVVGVMAVDNLPCELPKDASVDFGQMFIDHVLEPLTGNDPQDIIWRASETKDGKLTPHFAYLEDYIAGN